MRHRPGLSRVEVLVGLLIGGLLVGLFLAAITRLRESAKVASCRNNLKQLGLAVHNYIDTYDGRLPALTDQGDGAPTGGGMPSVFATLMHFIEATPPAFLPERPPSYYHAHSSVALTYPIKGTMYTQHGGFANSTWRWYIDPGDTSAEVLRDVPMTLPDGTTGYYATSSYAANGLAPWGTGSFLQLFPNGAQNTILMAERPQVCRTAGGDEVYNLWGLGFYSPHMPAFATLTPADPPGLWSTRQVAPAEPLPDEDVPDRDARIRVRIGRRDAAPQPPDFETPVQSVRGGRQCDPRLPATPHLAGMQVLMADGSVRVFGQDTSPWVFWTACAPAGAKGSMADDR
jgi:Protein of unknown function (DUF1559)